VLTNNQRAIIEQETGEPSDPYEPQRAITRGADELWAGGKVPYRISSSLGKCVRRRPHHDPEGIVQTSSFEQVLHTLYCLWRGMVCKLQSAYPHHVPPCRQQS